MRSTLSVGAVLLACVQSAALRLPGGPSIDRRGVLAQSAALIAAPFAVTPLLSPLPALADVYGANSDLPSGMDGVNKLLKSSGFPAMKSANGMSPLVRYIGTAPPANIDGQKVKERPFKDILLVRFLFPNGWLVASPDITENGEAGTIGANNFIKGDSATFTALAIPGGKKVADMDKGFFGQLLSSQMTNDVYEDVKPKKIKPVTMDDGTEMVQFDFGYTLLTRAGFTVERKGTASAMQIGDTAVGLICATTALRFKELEPQLRSATDSFRVYPVKSTALPGRAI